MNEQSVFAKKLEELGFERFDPERALRNILRVELVKDESEKAPPDESTHMEMPFIDTNEPCFTCIDGSAIHPTIQSDRCL